MNRRMWFVEMIYGVVSGFACTLIGWLVGKTSKPEGNISQSQENISGTGEKSYPPARITYRGVSFECLSIHTTSTSVVLSADGKKLGTKIEISVEIKGPCDHFDKARASSNLSDYVSELVLVKSSLLANRGQKLGALYAKIVTVLHDFVTEDVTLHLDASFIEYLPNRMTSDVTLT